MSVQAQLHASRCWESLVTLLHDSLENCDVCEITDKDFDQQGELVFQDRAVRVLYLGTGFKPIENQRTSYEAVHRFMLIAFEDDRRSQRDQSLASLILSQDAMEQVAGARLLLAGSHEQTEPITLLSCDLFPVADRGVGYAVGIEVPGPAVFPGVHAEPTLQE
ncbi:hypothetical protein ACFQBQ_07590 [Granulicella cerasi]|uniref:Uncharacterized protein n=1 Tax=Granulicella cerasi TaxID=741063 RepID=A0ABW1Z7N0_9BACT|nr:hypothetical protein [Granulicella cerasi]